MSRAMRRPDGYRWAKDWCPPPPIGTVLAGIGLMALGGAIGVGLSVYAGIYMGLIGSAALVSVWVPKRPSVVVEHGSVVLRYRLRRSGPGLFALILPCAGLAAIAASSALGPPVEVVLGFVLLVIAALFAALVLLSADSRMVFGVDTLVVWSSSGILYREFRWDAMTDPTIGASLQSAYVPEITFTCPADAVVERSSQQFLASELVRGPDRWALMASSFTVDPNALLATIRFMIEHPDRRARLTVADIRAMLTAQPTP